MPCLLTNKHFSLTNTATSSCGCCVAVAVLLQAGAVSGLAVGAALLRGATSASALQYLGYSSVGAAGGILLHVLTQPKEE
jgi:hypothetical protein